MFVSKSSWEYLANLTGSKLGELLLREPSREYSSNCDEAIFGVQKASLSMFWEHSPYSTNIASDWLRAELSYRWGRNKNKNGWRCCYVLHWLRREFVYLLTCGRPNLVLGTQNEIVVSWITLWGLIKVYWLDLTLAYIFDHAVCCTSAASWGQSLHLIISQLRMK